MSIIRVRVVRTIYGNSNSSEVKVSMHQGSALSPLLFVIVTHTHTHTYTIVLLLFWNLSRTTRVSRYQNGKNQEGKTNLDLLEQEIVSGSGICWAICKSALCTSSQITTPTSQSHDSVITTHIISIFLLSFLSIIIVLKNVTVRNK